MADNVGSETRSRMMAGVRAKHTQPELALRRALHASGTRFRLHTKLPGTPDLTFQRFKAVCFVHGCFWHRHSGCSRATTPTSRTEFWRDKFSRNVDRDGRSQRELRKAGWRVAIVWECALSRGRISNTVKTLNQWLRSDQPNYETVVNKRVVGTPDSSR